MLQTTWYIISFVRHTVSHPKKPQDLAWNYYPPLLRTTHADVIAWKPYSHMYRFNSYVRICCSWSLQLPHTAALFGCS